MEKGVKMHIQTNESNSNNYNNYPDEQKYKLIGEIDNFYSQVESIPHLFEKAQVIDQVLLQHFLEIQSHSNAIVQQFEQQREDILKKFDGGLLPAAKEVVKELSKDTSELKFNLDDTLQNIVNASKMDWVNHAKSWAQLYVKWYDQKALMQKVIKQASHHTQELIDRDVNLIKEYHKQSLSHLTPDSPDFKSTEEKLKRVIEEPLKRLVELKQEPGDLNIKQLSEWVSNLNQHRENYVDQVLTKIDSVIDTFFTGAFQEVVDNTVYIEIENEINFMEQEMSHIKQSIAAFDVNNQQEREFIMTRLNSAKEHLEQLDLARIPKDLRNRIEKLYEQIANSLVIIIVN